jgi:hypothetical protein
MQLTVSRVRRLAGHLDQMLAAGSNSPAHTAGRETTAKVPHHLATHHGGACS